MAVMILDADAHHLLAGRPAVRSGIWEGRCLRIADGGVLSQRGSKGAGWRVHGVHDPGRGTFSHLEITDSHGAESLLRCAPVAGEALIAGRGYARAEELMACLDRSGRDARDFIVRAGWRPPPKAGPLETIHGSPLVLPSPGE